LRPEACEQGVPQNLGPFPGPRYHVLGNHDTDGGFKREQTVEWWGMKDRFYSFDQGGIHFVVLDGNDRPRDHAGGYPRFIADDQLDWLRQDLSSTPLPVIVFVHQSLERESKGGVQNGASVRAVLEEANQRQEKRQVVACLSGHHHRDYVRRINDILYPQINSASYYWVGPKFQKVRYSSEIDAAYPMIKNTVPYKDPLFAIVTTDPIKGFMRIEGRQSEFVGPAPWDLGGDKDSWEAASLAAGIADWKMPM
jgi:3',5'-cyclic AMP phosphodiesterase CpdA